VSADMGVIGGVGLLKEVEWVGEKGRHINEKSGERG